MASFPHLKSAQFWYKEISDFKMNPFFYKIIMLKKAFFSNKWILKTKVEIIHFLVILPYKSLRKLLYTKKNCFHFFNRNSFLNLAFLRKLWRDVLQVSYSIWVFPTWGYEKKYLALLAAKFLQIFLWDYKQVKEITWDEISVATLHLLEK